MLHFSSCEKTYFITKPSIKIKNEHYIWIELRYFNLIKTKAHLIIGMWCHQSIDFIIEREIQRLARVGNI